MRISVLKGPSRRYRLIFFFLDFLIIFFAWLTNFNAFLSELRISVFNIFVHSILECEVGSLRIHCYDIMA